MHLALNKITANPHVMVRGDESWLERIYAEFPEVDADGVRPPLSAKLQLTVDEAGAVLVAGVMHYAPRVPCSRCAAIVAWPMTVDVAARFLPAARNEVPKEKTLSRDELDDYYLEDNSVDLETLLNDCVQTALPTRFLPTLEDGHRCRACATEASDDQVYGSATDSSDRSPFATLKGLKLPH